MEPLQRGGGAKYKGCGKISRFSTEIAVYLGNDMRCLWLLWNVNRKSYALSNGDIFNELDVDYPLPGFHGHGLFEVEYLKNSAS